MKIIAHIKSDYTDKFGIPRQSGMAPEVISVIEFEKEYRSVNALRGLDGFSHIWIIWQFSKAEKDNVSLTVRPPRLGGNKRVGVFATRSPYRPNPIGLSCVKIEKIDLESDNSPLIYVSGADMLSGTPIYDIKPYLPHIDAVSDAKGGFADEYKEYSLKVEKSPLTSVMPSDKERAIYKILSLDPRPSYISDGNRVYGLDFGGYNVRFSVSDNTVIILSVKKI